MKTKEFQTRDVMSTITDRLMGDIGGVYGVLSWMTGESVFTHQLRRISKEAVPVILAMYPSLQQAIDEADQVTPENFEKWREEWEKRYGPMICVPKFGAADHERIDPISELAEKVHPDCILAVKL